jgi:hypothetical protein
VRSSAADLLLAAGIDPQALARAVPGINPSRVRVRVAFRWFEAFWGRDIAAVALPWGIYLRRDLASRRPFRLAPLIVHELAHIRQWQLLGPRRLLASYLGDYLRGRCCGLSHSGAYLAIGLEQEARHAARGLGEPRRGCGV